MRLRLTMVLLASALALQPVSAQADTTRGSNIPKGVGAAAAPVLSPQLRDWVDGVSDSSAKATIVARLKDPESARFSELRPGRDAMTGLRAVCGYVNAKNSYGGYTGATQFIVTSRYSALRTTQNARFFDPDWEKVCRADTALTHP